MTEERPLLVVVDDEQSILNVVARFGHRAGFEVVACPRGREALAELQARRADLVLIDLRMPDVGGFDVLRAIRERDANCRVALMTGYASVDTAIEAIKLGAVDYLRKPIDFGRLGDLLASVREDFEKRRSAAPTDVARRLECCGMIGRSPAMLELFEMLRRLAPHVRTALVTGETGTGKELAARALHRMGPRGERRFVSVGCSTVVEALFESELFGHVRGAFAGAVETRPGLIEQADGGTVFFDEIADLPAGVQAKLLRVLELGEVHRIGSLDPRRVDVHVIAATTRDLRTEALAGRFRGDLYYRLNIVEIRLPALRDRREDIPILTAAFVDDIARRLHKRLRGVTPAAEGLLTAAPWDGNVRELRNVIERAGILADEELITERELAVSMPPARSARPAAPPAPAGTQKGERLADVEREHIQRALVLVGGNKKAAAQMLGLSRRALYRRLERLNLTASINRRRAATPLGA